MWLKRAALFALKIFPREFASRLAGRISDKRLPKIILLAWVNLYCKIYGVDMGESEKSAYEFGTFNEFFARRLKPGSREIDSSEESAVSPVDGTVMEFGKIRENTLIQAKGKEYYLESLLEDAAASKKFGGGSFITIYLAPEDYHRIHAPVSGRIAGYSYIPGYLFPVNDFSSKAIDSLFSKNERLITYMEYRKKNLAIVKIGACIVGRIRADYESLEFDTSCRIRLKKKYSKGIPVKKGDEIGRFEIGSTVVLLFEKSGFEFGKVSKGMKIKMGQKIGVLR